MSTEFFLHLIPLLTRGTCTRFHWVIFFDNSIFLHPSSHSYLWNNPCLMFTILVSVHWHCMTYRRRSLDHVGGYLCVCVCVFVCGGIKSYWFPHFLWCDWKVLCFFNHSLNLCTLLLSHKLCNMRKLKGSYISVLSSSCGSTVKKPCSMVKCL